MTTRAAVAPAFAPGEEITVTSHGGAGTTGRIFLRFGWELGVKAPAVTTDRMTSVEVLDATEARALSAALAAAADDVDPAGAVPAETPERTP